MKQIIFSEKKDGPLNIEEDRKSFFKKRKIKKFVYTKNAHGKDVIFVDSGYHGKVIENKDGLITTEEDLFIGIFVADCFPVFFWNKDLVAVAHAGWRGVKEGIISNILSKIREVSFSDVYAQIGPGIGECHFEVKEDVAKDFPSFIEKREGKMFLDLQKAIRENLLEEGIKNIKESSMCTYCEKGRYFSYRRDNNASRMLALISKKI